MFQKGGAFLIIVPLLATVLGLIGGSLFRYYCTEITNSFTKKILIKQAELDRFQ